MAEHEQLLLKLHRLIRDFPRYNRFIGSPLSLSESHFLVELDAARSLTASQLVERLGIQKTVVSGLQASLLERGMIVLRGDAKDRRQKFISITENGRGQVRKYDRQSDRLLQSFVSLGRLERGDIERLKAFLEVLSQGLNAPHSAQRPHEHCLRGPIRRLTRAFKLLGQNALETGLSPLQWQILLEVALHSAPPDIKTLLAIFRIGAPTGSQAVRVLAAKQLLRKLSSSSDARSTLLEVTPAGRALIRRAEQKQVGLMDPVFRPWPVTSLRDLVAITQRFMHGAAVHFYLLEQGYRVREVTSDKDLKFMRRSQVEFWARTPPENFPDSLYSRRSRCWGLLRDNKVEAGCELSPGNQGAEFTNVFWGQQDSSIIKTFLEHVLSGGVNPA